MKTEGIIDEAVSLTSSLDMWSLYQWQSVAKERSGVNGSSTSSWIDMKS